MLCCCGQHCVCVCVCVAEDWVSSSRLIPVDLQSCCINYEELYKIKNGGEVRKRLLLHRWRGWIWNTGMCNLLTHAHTFCIHPPSLLLLFLVVEIHRSGLTNIKGTKESINKAKVPDPFYKMKKRKSKAAEEISIPTLIPALVNFQCRQPLRPVKSNVTPGEG